MVRTDAVRFRTLAACSGLLVFVAACSSTPDEAEGSIAGNDPSCAESGTCSGPNGTDTGGGGGGSGGSSGGPSAPVHSNGVRDGDETDVDCGGASAPKCAVGLACSANADCTVACGYDKKCVEAPSCTVHLGGDTCGDGEVGDGTASHESCCRSLPVPGFADAAHPGKQVYLDKYEITAGRVRAWIEALAAESGEPDVKRWIEQNRPDIWDASWDAYLPTGYEGPNITVPRRLLGDPRPEDNGWTGPPGPGVILPPATDQVKNLGVNRVFGSEVYVDLHGMNCGTWSGTYGSPTYYYPPEVLTRDAQQPRADGTGYDGEPIPAKDLLDVKAINCIPNALLAAFCAWDGGQLATDEVLDHVTATPASLGNVSGCGPQIDNHGRLLKNDFTGTVQSGGVCPPVTSINATFDAGDDLPVPNSPLNMHNYHYPDLGQQSFDKAWQVSAPGRASTAPAAGGKPADVIFMAPNQEPWMDLAGNLSEAVLDVSGGTFTGVFGLKFRGLGYGSARSDLNVTLMKGESVQRLQRPEAKGMYTGGRCMRFR